MLLVGAGLFVRSLERVQSQDLGFSTTGVLYATLEPQRFVVPGPERDPSELRRCRRSFAGWHRYGARQWSKHFRSAPSMFRRSVFLVWATCRRSAISFLIYVWRHAGLPKDDRCDVATRPAVHRCRWTRRTARGARQRDDGASRVAGRVGDSKCVRAGYGSGSIATLEAGGNPAEMSPCREVVGVVRDSRARSLRVTGNEAKFMQYYVPFAQLPTMPFANASYVNGSVPPGERRSRSCGGDHPADHSEHEHCAALRESPRVSGLDRPTAAIVADSVRHSSRRSARWRSALPRWDCSASSRISSRSAREIGVRLALGATRVGMSRMVVRDALRLVVAGVAAGGAAAMAARTRARHAVSNLTQNRPTS